MKTVKVTYANGDSITTGINGSDDEIRQYFAIGRRFNIGSDDDNMQAVTALDFLSGDLVKVGDR